MTEKVTSKVKNERNSQAAKDFSAAAKEAKKSSIELTRVNMGMYRISFSLSGIERSLLLCPGSQKVLGSPYIYEDEGSSFSRVNVMRWQEHFPGISEWTLSIIVASLARIIEEQANELRHPDYQSPNAV